MEVQVICSWRGGWEASELSVGLFPNINTCVKSEKSSLPITQAPSASTGVWGRGARHRLAAVLLHPLGMSPTSLLLLIVEEMALRVSPNGGGSLDQLPGIGVHTPALPTLSIQRHLALRGEKSKM